jgi:hypothetical protein
LQIFKEVIEALSAAGDAIKSLTDGIAHLIRTGASGYSYLAASRERDRLISISANASFLATFNIRSIEETIEGTGQKYPLHLYTSECIIWPGKPYSLSQ